MGEAKIMFVRKFLKSKEATVYQRRYRSSRSSDDDDHDHDEDVVIVNDQA